jgi:tRNA G26 N,N-dimethylase Trm1
MRRRAIGSPNFVASLGTWIDGGPVMQDHLGKAERYRKEAARCHERAKVAQPAYLGDFFRQVAVRYMFMAQEAENGQLGAEKSR